MDILIFILVIAWCYFSAYVVSLYALAVYIDPEDISELIPDASDRHRQTLIKLVNDPRAFVQVATVYSSFVLVVISVCVVFLTDRIIVGFNPVFWYPGSLLLAWLFFIVCAQYLPRRTSRTAIDRNMLRYLRLISVIFRLFFPVVSVYRRGLIRYSREHQVTEEEKEEIVERAIETLAEQAGIGEAIVEQDEKEMIGHIFQLDQTLVREIMIPRIDLVAVEKSTRFVDIRDLVRRDGHSRYPVYESSIDKIVGILYVKDLFTNLPQPGEEFVISKYLRNPYFVPETKIIGDLLREFRTRKLHLAMVVDEYGGVAGLVTLEDILEEIVGEIQDEHDSEPEECQVQPDGSYIVDAAMQLDKLQERLETEFHQDENDTVGGLIYDLVGSVPEVGTCVSWNDLQFEVLGLDGQRILSVRVNLTQSPPN
ncbi:MAG: HlyC/CorC family transporter [candidate division Zixibacteria bacterium]|nr:HlyC/CorC family transporter [candidate division Zixibacteria bacterium]